MSFSRGAPRHDAALFSPESAAALRTAKTFDIASVFRRLPR
jgi:hypothetical protein